ncbi:MAG: glycoside hydrolase family 15 protein [Bacteroidia bacterium]|nr:glycoside hydrolase family 15 protein [Bacteroidia bacterium]
MQRHKYNLGLIGNCAYSALIDNKARVRWMCLPRFDSSFIFGNLLDEKKGGEYSIQSAQEEFKTVQSYLFNTNILQTRFEACDGSFVVEDFAPRFRNLDRIYKPLMLIRKVTPLKGSPRVRIVCNPVGDYGNIIPKVVKGSNHLHYSGLDQDVRLTTNAPLNYIENQQSFVLNKPIFLVLTYGAPMEAELQATAERFYQNTITYWRDWIMNTSAGIFRQESVLRSALVLQLHQYQDTGAITAATTTSLPEFPGSTRNWDYRFCWLRDAHYTIKALNDLSHFSVLIDYANFIDNIVIGENKRFSPLYPITLDRIPEETILDLEGYRGEKPVRIGNQANEHIQNDAYGQVLVTLLPFFVDKRLPPSDHSSLLAQVNYCLEMIETTMNEPDNGLWEFRGTSQLHSYTFLFHWAGASAALKIAQDIGDRKMQSRARRLIKASKQMIEACYDEDRGVYTQAVGSKNLDASLLQLINMGYLDPNSKRAKQHIAVLEKELKTPTGLFYRYKHADDFGEPESTFLICAFWYVEALARMNRVKEAIEIFDMLLSHRNHLGLLSEDIHEASGSQWGNFPQTYSHVGLINAAFAISNKLDKPNYL